MRGDSWEVPKGMEGSGEGRRVFKDGEEFHILTGRREGMGRNGRRERWMTERGL